MAGRPNVFFTGVGKINAAACTAELIERYRPRRIINFGTAGGVTVGSGLHQATRFVQRDMTCVELGCEPGQTPGEHGVALDFGGSGLTCSSGDNFVTNPDLDIAADLVDMEAYAIAKVCQKKRIEFVCYKFVSDQADETAHRDWAKMISAGQQHYLNQLHALGL
jgi:adenosylhomocysteine nucleosidase